MRILTVLVMLMVAAGTVSASITATPIWPGNGDTITATTWTGNSLTTRSVIVTSTMLANMTYFFNGTLNPTTNITFDMLRTIAKWPMRDVSAIGSTGQLAADVGVGKTYNMTMLKASDVSYTSDGTGIFFNGTRQSCMNVSASIVPAGQVWAIFGRLKLRYAQDNMIYGDYIYSEMGHYGGNEVTRISIAVGVRSTHPELGAGYSDQNNHYVGWSGYSVVENQTYDFLLQFTNVTHGGGDFYINGVSQGYNSWGSAWSGLMPNANARSTIGCAAFYFNASTGDTYHMNGTIWDVQIYNRTFNATEVMAMHKGTLYKIDDTTWNYTSNEIGLRHNTPYNFTVSACNLGGECTSSTENDFTMSNLVLTITNPWLNQSTLTGGNPLQGNATVGNSGNTLDKFWVTFNNSIQGIWSASSGNNVVTINVDPSLRSGTYNVTFYVNDTGGDVNKTSDIWIVDTRVISQFQTRWYKLDEVTPGNAIDSIGGHNVAPINTPIQGVSGVSLLAANFTTALGAYFSSTGDDDTPVTPGIGTNWTACYWFKQNRKCTGSDGCFQPVWMVNAYGEDCLTNNANITGCFGMYSYGNNGICLSIGVPHYISCSAPGKCSCYYRTPLGSSGDETKVWYHACMVYWGYNKSLEVYMNATNRYDDYWTNSAQLSSTQTIKKFSIGTWQNKTASAYYWNGTLDEVRFWNITLTQPEILTVFQYRGSAGGAPCDLPTAGSEWAINCTANCNLTSNIVVGNVTTFGTGTFTMNGGNITSRKKYINTGCSIYMRNDSKWYYAL